MDLLPPALFLVADERQEATRLATVAVAAVAVAAVAAAAAAAVTAAAGREKWRVEVGFLE